ncbi:hypothetical protein O3G_MSEX010808 [Manduca sexta]|uniref:Uncharacterized protein n=1 Tax=Manduca sexta TaxID=7130 RepID=A0A922CSY4_MANSE|nr:hypothetical protein O3G_MSEX010808 [Manduca sexta]
MDDDETHEFWMLEETQLVINNRKTRKSYSFRINNTCVLCFVIWYLYMMMLLRIYQMMLTKQENMLTQVRMKFLETRQEMDRVQILDNKLAFHIGYVKSLLKNKTTYDTGY